MDGSGAPSILLLYGLVFASCFMLAEAVYYFIGGDARARSRTLSDRMKRHASRIQAVDIDDAGTILKRREDLGGLMGFLTPLVPRRQSLDLLLYRAGMPMTFPQFVMATVLLGMAGLSLGSAVLLNPALGIVLGGVLGGIPFATVSYMKRQRMKKFEEQFPEGVELLCRALRAGISLEFGFRSVGEELSDPVGTEFGQVADEVSLGLDTRIALENLAQRMNTSDMPFFTNAIMIQRETGGNLAEILGNLAYVVRERLKFYGKVRTLLAQTNLTANVLAMLPIGFGLLVRAVRPSYVEAFATDSGQIWLIAAGVMVVLGWIVCRRMASIDT